MYICLQTLSETQEKLEGLRSELECVREEGREKEGRLKEELQGREERVREMEGEVRAVREQLEEKDSLLRKKEEVRGMCGIEIHIHVYTWKIMCIAH